jgi:nucleotide-binding universal stress UspA family protein
MNSKPEIRRILVPHDFSEAAANALSYALGVSEKFGARVTVMHVYEIPAIGAAEALAAGVEFASVVERVTAKALERVASRARESNVDLDTELRTGTPWMEIITVAERMKADLIVIGTHGRKGVSRMLLGSVAEKVVRTAPCPVLTVHAPALHSDSVAENIRTA